MADNEGTWDMDISVKFVPNDKGAPAGKLADAEIHFGPDAGLLAGLRLVGFAVWERRGGARNVVMPARQYTINGERRSFALLRPIVDAKSETAILSDFATFEAEIAAETFGR
jgi:hypothetical protein